MFLDRSFGEYAIYVNITHLLNPILFSHKLKLIRVRLDVESKTNTVGCFILQGQFSNAQLRCFED